MTLHLRWEQERLEILSIQDAPAVIESNLLIVNYQFFHDSHYVPIQEA
jgi:hypothetical protein